MRICLMHRRLITRRAARGGERLLIAANGWLATDATGAPNGACVTALAQSPPDQLAYFDDLVRGATAGNADLVTWWSNRDVAPSAIFGTMGLRGYEGNPRAVFFDRWSTLRAMPIAPQRCS
jgi:hypothetical protein